MRRVQEVIASEEQFSVDKAPNVLQIQLKRFEFVPFGRGKLSQFIEYPLVLDLTSYLTSSLKINEGRRGKKRKSANNKPFSMILWVVVAGESFFIVVHRCTI